MKKAFQRILLLGGAGFVGSNLALFLKADRPQADIIAVDNLKRRGSEMALSRLCDANVTFVHGDVRNPEDLESVGSFDLLLDCAAEPSVHAGYEGDARYLINTNLVGAFNALEAARRCKADVIFLSSSRVYPIAPMRALPLEKKEKRFVLPNSRQGPGWSPTGISTSFPLAGARSLYGASKLAAELLIEEYRTAYGLRAIINRCGVITGPWQMGKVDQGFIVLWAARHCYGGSLSYTGFGGEGFQVRDILHVADLYELLRIEIDKIEELDGSTFNVGGGLEISVSLCELTDFCTERSERSINIGSQTETRLADIPYYVTDNTEVTNCTGWKPKRNPAMIVDEIFSWLQHHQRDLEPILR